MLRVWVGNGGDVAKRLVQSDVVSLNGDGNLLVVNGYLVAIQVNVRPLSHDRLAVHLNAAPRNQFLGFAARSDSGGGEHFL